LSNGLETARPEEPLGLHGVVSVAATAGSPIVV
jgi:hypothetical protein